MNEINNNKIVVIKNFENLEEDESKNKNIMEEIRNEKIKIIPIENNNININNNNKQNKLKSIPLIKKNDDSKKNKNYSNRDIYNNIISKDTNLDLSLKNDINLESSIFPYCIVWTPIPIITYIIPTIGHSGIGDSNGLIHDYANSYYVKVFDFSFGKPTKYLKLDLTKEEKINYDKAIEKADNKFSNEKYYFFRNNCHHHVSFVLNELNYNGRKNYSIASIWWMLITKGKFVSFCGFCKTYCGFFIIILIIVLIVIIIFLVKKLN